MARGLLVQWVREEATMGYAMSTGGLLVHDREDWPCAVCRPEGTGGRRGHCLCMRCAHAALAAAGAGVQDARDLIDDLTDALVFLEPEVHKTPELIDSVGQKCLRTRNTYRVHVILTMRRTI